MLTYVHSLFDLILERSLNKDKNLKMVERKFSGQHYCLFVSFNQAFYFNIVVVSHAVLRKNPEILRTLDSVYSNGNSLQDYNMIL